MFVIPEPYFVESCASTNLYIEENLELFKKNFQAIWCAKQTAGRGRQNRFWQMQEKKDLAFSMIYFLPSLAEPQSAFSYTLTAGMALAKALQFYTHRHVLKWPNDIMVKEKKLAGILCQSINFKNKSAVIVGIGLNVNSEEKNLPNSEKSISLIDLQINNSRTPIELSGLMQKILFSLAIHFKEHSFPFSLQWQNQWMKLCACQNKKVHVNSFALKSTGEEKFFGDGEVVGIDAQGCLLIKSAGKIFALQEGTLRDKEN